ncbi:12719_t:CDS:2, partial [Acaulospora colombiana]
MPNIYSTQYTDGSESDNSAGNMSMEYGCHIPNFPVSLDQAAWSPIRIRGGSFPQPISLVTEAENESSFQNNSITWAELLNLTDDYHYNHPMPSLAPQSTESAYNPPPIFLPEFSFDGAQVHAFNPWEGYYPIPIGNSNTWTEYSSSSSTSSNLSSPGPFESLDMSSLESPSLLSFAATDKSQRSVVSPSQGIKVDRIALRTMCEDGSHLAPAYRKLLAYILDADCYISHITEPRIGTAEGDRVLQYLEEVDGVQFPQHKLRADIPLSALLTDPNSRRCLLCGAIKTSAQRAIECVGSHLDYRPFGCTGFTGGCPTCRPGYESFGDGTEEGYMPSLGPQTTKTTLLDLWPEMTSSLFSDIIALLTSLDRLKYGWVPVRTNRGPCSPNTTKTFQRPKNAISSSYNSIAGSTVAVDSEAGGRTTLAPNTPTQDKSRTLNVVPRSVATRSFEYFKE